MRRAIKRVYHSHELWEETPMWRTVTAMQRRRYAAQAAILMREPDKFKRAMQKALRDWPISCEFNLSNVSNNRLAWLGHAGCYAALQSPEDATRFGWNQLNEIEQDEANRVAQEVIDEWEENYAQA